jgi:hypothetical protein
MSPHSGIGSGSTIDDLLDATLRRLDSIEEKLYPLGRVLASVGGVRDGALHVDNGTGTCGAGNSDILAVGEGDDALPTDDNSGALRTDDDSDMPSGGSGSDGDATTPVIGVASDDSSLSADDVLATIGDGTIGAIYGGDLVAIGDGYSITIGGGGNLNTDALRVGDDDNILSVGDLGTDDQCSSDGSGALAAGKANILKSTSRPPYGFWRIDDQQLEI